MADDRSKSNNYEDDFAMVNMPDNNDNIVNMSINYNIPPNTDGCIFYFKNIGSKLALADDNENILHDDNDDNSIFNEGQDDINIKDNYSDYQNDDIDKPMEVYSYKPQLKKIFSPLEYSIYIIYNRNKKLFK